MPERPLPIEGLLIIDKPAGWTSHDVVGRLRRLTGVRRIGHAGTLDPLATGVLPLGIGQGTRVLEYISDAEKRYVATVELGTTTDTYDADGTVAERGDWSGVTEAAIRRSLDAFLGQIEQRPPPYSAIKQGGVPLYRLARAGRDVAPPPRTVTIAAIRLIRIDLPRLTIDVTCSKGTYIRSLAHELGRRLGCGGHLIALRRTATSGFTIEQAIMVERFEGMLTDGSWPTRILPADTALIDRPALILDQHDSERLRSGIVPSMSAPLVEPNTLVRAYEEDGYLLAVIRWRGPQVGWKAEKVLQGR